MKATEKIQKLLQEALGLQKLYTEKAIKADKQGREEESDILLEKAHSHETRAQAFLEALAILKEY